jgi:hypothetical protein
MFSCDLHQFPFSSPINNLPIELLSYIFSLSSHPEEKEEEHRPTTITLVEKVTLEEKEEDRPPTITTESVRGIQGQATDDAMKGKSQCEYRVCNYW